MESMNSSSTSMSMPDNSSSMSSSMMMMHHGDMNMSSHSSHMMPMMWMYFHTAVADTVLFKFWRVDSAGPLIISCLLLATASICCEALKWLRLRHDAYIQQQQQQQQPSDDLKGYNGHGRGAAGRNNFDNNGARTRTKDESSRTEATNGTDSNHQQLSHHHPQGPWSQQLAKSALYALQLLLSYLLMLAVMTYSVWLMASVVLGALVGHFLFNYVVPPPSPGEESMLVMDHHGGCGESELRAVKVKNRTVGMAAAKNRMDAPCGTEM